MRILWLLPTLNYRGAERLALHVAQGLTQKDYQIKLIFLKKEKEFPDLDQFRHLQIFTTNKYTRLFLSSPLLFMLFSPLVVLIQTWKNINHVDYLFAESYPCFPFSAIIAKLYKKKVIWFVHDFEPQAPESILKKIYTHFILVHYKLSLPLVDLVITNSPKTNRNIQKYFPLLRIHEILPPINMSRLDHPNHYPVRYDYHIGTSPLILLIGALHPLKNQKLALDTLKILHLTDPKTTILLVGGGNQKNLIRHAEQLKLPPETCIFAGYVPDEQIKNYYAACDLLLITSLSQGDGLNITGFEALYMHRLPISTTGAGIAEILQNENIGIVSNYDSQSLANKISNYFQNRDKYKQMIESGHQFVINNLKIEDYALQLNKIITQLH